VVKAAHRYKAANQKYGKQNMVVYELAALASAKDGGLDKFPRTSKLFPTSDPVDSFVETEARVYSIVEEYPAEKKEGQ
jgi:hypothetical protein